VTAPDALPISAVIPAYNSAPTLARAIASIRAQTRPLAEIIVVDDGSSDHTARVARNLGAVVVEQANAGSGGARNTGIQTASQPWIALLDADDEWLPEKLEVEWRALQLRPEAGIVCADIGFVTAGGTAARPVLLDHQSYRKLARIRLEEDVSIVERSAAAHALIAGNFIHPSTVIVRRDLVMPGNLFLGKADLETTAMCFEAEDCEWALRLMRFTDLLVVERTLAVYRVQLSSQSINQGRMRYGDIVLGRRVLRNPTLYPAGLGPDVLAIRPLKRREAVMEFLRRGQTSFARTMLVEAFEERHTLGNALRLALATLIDNGLGRGTLEAMAVVWKRVVKGRLPNRVSAPL